MTIPKRIEKDLKEKVYSTTSDDINVKSGLAVGSTLTETVVGAEIGVLIAAGSDFDASVATLKTI